VVNAGVTRPVERRGVSRTAAHAALREELGRRGGQADASLRANSRCHDAAGDWLAKITDRRAASTVETYSYWLDTLVLPRLGERRLSELTVARVEEFFSGLERESRAATLDDGTVTEMSRYSAGTRSTIRVVVSGILRQAVLAGAIPADPDDRPAPLRGRRRE
jgi:hypothetical protein